ncbi:DUF11 domain-containing protein [Blautia massiliensis (ex Durand et al. 2017)]|uniref:DUF11 domain-containing protein n=1 Tax=Blautia massiliensis (ex Durand et al. 2017) TaxID=1737424 RepID=UPI001570A0E6|nr:DUF11 domain-containing protein [Blautia massiliensis (ex Durand et al. 2017)]NSK74245.1 DUF11 domain-containing protein [Blautia massiliensis (ex Durand et al. 2017)]
MKNRIWKQMKKAGIVTVLAGAMLRGTIEPKLTLGADFLPGQAPFIDQSVFWKDIESGQAELGIRIRGLNEWLSGRRFSEDKEKNEKRDDELQKIEDPLVEQEEEIEPELPENDLQQEEEPEQELPEDDLQQEEKAEQELPVDKVVEGIGIEMEEGYEHVEQLASGETVQPEDEEQEKTGPLTAEGTSTGGENVGNEEGESEETQKLTLVTYISEYFVPETDSVPKNMAAQQISVRSQSGEATEITKLESVLNVEQNGQDEIFFRIPLILRQEYRFPAEKSSYPVIQEEPLQKDCTGAGTFLMTEENGEKLVIAEGISPMLDVEAAEADMELSVIAQNKKMKAGQTIRYQVEIANTGKLDLADIRLTSSLSCPKIRQLWEDAEGLLTEGAVAEFAELKAGESRSFYVQAPLLDEQEKDLEHQVEAEARVKDRVEEVIRKNASTINGLEALKADLSVKKTADKETAAPGETVTYQICIVNTGEKTLHSVVGTERFQAAGIHAQFLEQEGVTLNSSRTKAMIQQIPPGEAVSLQAVVKIPGKTADQKLFNQVTVTSQETGERLMEASASVMVKGEVAITPEEGLPLQGDDQGPASGQIQMARTASTHPKTGDDTRRDLWTLLAVTALVTVLGGIWLRKKYADIYGKS